MTSPDQTKPDEGASDNDIYVEPTSAVKALLQSTRDHVQAILAQRGEVLAPDEAFSPISAQANHYGMPRKAFLILLDEAGIRRRRDGAPSDRALHADAARLVPITNRYSLESSTQPAYWRWHREKLYSLLVSTGAIEAVNANRREQAKFHLRGWKMLPKHFAEVKELLGDAKLSESVVQVTEAAKTLLALLKSVPRPDDKISEVSTKLKKDCARLDRVLKKRGTDNIPARMFSMSLNMISWGAKDALISLASVQTSAPKDDEGTE
jgi:hypothetical protein